MKISLTNITKSFGGKQVIRPTDLTVDSGSFTTLLGPSGLWQDHLAADDRWPGGPGHWGDLAG